MNEGLKAGSVPNYAARRKNRSQCPDVWDRRQWCVGLRKWPGRECRRSLACSGRRWRQSLPQGEDDVEIFGVERFLLTLLNPLGAGQRLALWAMPVATRVLADAFVLALIALFQMTAEGCSSAVSVGPTHDEVQPWTTGKFSNSCRAVKSSRTCNWSCWSKDLGHQPGSGSRESTRTPIAFLGTAAVEWQESWPARNYRHICRG